MALAAEKHNAQSKPNLKLAKIYINVHRCRLRKGNYLKKSLVIVKFFKIRTPKVISFTRAVISVGTPSLICKTELTTLGFPVVHNRPIIGQAIFTVFSDIK